MIERENIGIFGKMNAGKSSVMNLISQQATSIVDEKAGTTTDTIKTLMEIHGIGPVRLFDTAGLDEEGSLADKKKEKVMNDFKEIDLAIVVINPSTKNFDVEKKLIDDARELDKQVLIVYNLFSKADEKHIADVENEIPALTFHKKIMLSANDMSYRNELIEFVRKNYEPKNTKMELLPFIKKDEFYVLNIPMDDETPPGRYLRPQAMAEEYITRHWAYPVSYRMNLGDARSNDSKLADREKKRFSDFLSNFAKRPKALITDSQAMDIMRKWMPSDIPYTTFSIMSINYMSRGRLKLFADGLKALDTLKAGDKVLIAEACNHSRIGEDIGTVQIPKIFSDKYKGVIIEHNFGREFAENKNLNKYKLIIHCGGCMISQQKLSARIRDLITVGVPFTNYGLFLSYMQGKDALNKVMELWNIKA